MSGGRFDGVTAVVTGGARGIGAAQAVALLSEGAHVVIGDVLVEEGAALARSLGAAARFVSLDVASPVQWSAAVDLDRSWPPLRVLVNNAGIHHATPIEFETAEAAMDLWRVNLLGPMLGIQQVTPHMRAAGGGSIVNISSAAGLIGMASTAAYGSSKWGLRGISRTAAIELGGDGIRVNCVMPGYIDTTMFRSARSGDRQHELLPAPLGRRGVPEDIVGAVLFLASEESSYVTGAEIAVDGGVAAGMYPSSSSPDRPAAPLDG